MRTALKITAAAIGSFLVLVLVGVIGWQFGWWLKAKNVDRGGRLIDRSYNHQIGLRQQVLDSINDLTIHADMTDGQKVRITMTTCDAIDQMLNQYKTPTITIFETSNCKGTQ